jgi:uncharacterized protein involved in exopolysaccharide biosynthesis
VSATNQPAGLRYLVGAVALGMCAGLAVGLIAIGVTFLLPRQFQATARFSPEAGSNSRLPAGISELASQFALDLGSPALKPLQYYSVVLHSDAVLDRVLNSPLDIPGCPPTLWSYLEGRLTHRDSLPRERARKWLRDRTSVSINYRASTLELGATLPDRRMAAATTNLLLDALNYFNKSTRTSQARARREYLQHALAFQLDSLRQAEDSLQRFLERNRLYKGSPALDFQEKRLSRKVDLMVQVVSTVQRDLEAARLDEINSTPMLSVIDSATPPLRPTSPKTLRIGALSGFLAASAAVYAAVLGFSEARPRSGPTLKAAVLAVRLERRWNRLLRRVSTRAGPARRPRIPPARSP